MTTNGFKFSILYFFKKLIKYSERKFKMHWINQFKLVGVPVMKHPRSLIDISINTIYIYTSNIKRLIYFCMRSFQTGILLPIILLFC